MGVKGLSLRFKVQGLGLRDVGLRALELGSLGLRALGPLVAGVGLFQSRLWFYSLGFRVEGCGA